MVGPAARVLLCVKSEIAEATPVASASSIPFGARVRIPGPDLRPRRERVPRGPGRRYRYGARARKLTPDQEATIRALGATKSLRSLAADFGVSHETVRAVCRGRVT